MSFGPKYTMIGAALAVFAIISVGDPMAANAKVSVFKALLDGPSEAPANTSPGTGTAFLTIDDIFNTLRLEVTFSDLEGTTTVAHIHAPTSFAGEGTVGVATTTPTFLGFPSGVKSGTYDQTFDMLMAGSYNPNFINNNGGTPASAQFVLFGAISDGKAYLNIHSTQYPGGEIRGFFKPETVPGPLPLLGVGAAFGWSRQLRKRYRQNPIGN